MESISVGMYSVRIVSVCISIDNRRLLFLCCKTSIMGNEGTPELPSLLAEISISNEYGVEVELESVSLLILYLLLEVLYVHY